VYSAGQIVLHARSSFPPVSWRTSPISARPCQLTISPGTMRICKSVVTVGQSRSLASMLLGLRTFISGGIYSPQGCANLTLTRSTDSAEAVRVSHRPAYLASNGLSSPVSRVWTANCTIRPRGTWRRPVGFQNSATGVDLGFYAARSYSLMRPPRMGLWGSRTLLLVLTWASMRPARTR